MTTEGQERTEGGCWVKEGQWADIIKGVVHPKLDLPIYYSPLGGSGDIF